MNSTVTPANVSGSVVLKSNSSERNERVRTSDPPNPRTMPNKAVRIPCLRTSRSTLPTDAPSAILIPNSPVRLVTVYAVTPYRPAMAKNSATPANIATSVRLNCRDLSDDAITCVSVLKLGGTFGSSECKMLRADKITAPGSASVRKTTVKLYVVCGRCW